MFYSLHPEVAGGLGPKTFMDSSAYPPLVKTLNYELDGWLGDDILESFPCFIVTEALKSALIEAGLKGILFAEVLVTKSELFDDLYPQRQLPAFWWMQVNGDLCADDFSATDKGELVVSSRAKEVLSNFNMSHAAIEVFDC